MSIKKKQEKKTSMGAAESPYFLEGSTEIDDCYDRYLNDPTRIIEMGGRLFYKVFYRLKVYLHNDNEALVWFDNVVAACVGTVLTDELGHRYYVMGIPMFRFINNRWPAWYLKADAHLLVGDFDVMGEYLTRTDERLCRCLCPPKIGNFKRNGFYRWTYIIDAVCVYDNNGTEWSADEIHFAMYFAKVSGK